MTNEQFGTLVTDEKFPHGLRCIECDRLLPAGDRYSERLERLTAAGVPIVSIVCVPCALRGSS